MKYVLRKYIHVHKGNKEKKSYYKYQNQCAKITIFDIKLQPLFWRFHSNHSIICHCSILHYQKDPIIILPQIQQYTINQFTDSKILELHSSVQTHKTFLHIQFPYDVSYSPLPSPLCPEKEKRDMPDRHNPFAE